MDFIQRHMFYIICVVAALAGIALAVTGLGAMPKVVTDMDQAKRLYQDLESLARNPVNQEAIAVEDRRIELTAEDYARVIEKAKALYHYEPLVPGAFPDGTDDDLREFRRKYEEALDHLFESLKSGEPAKPVDIDNMRDRIEDEEARRKARGLDPGAVLDEEEDEGPPRDAAGVLTPAGARTDAAARAHMAMARGFYCYALKQRQTPLPNYVSSLDFDPEMVDLGMVDAPDIEFAWRAQLKYWIVKDVVNAIVAVNGAAAKEASQNPWVGILPIKDVVSIRVSDEYIPPEGDEYDGAGADDFKEALPPGSAEKVFTGTTSNATFDVLQFTLKLVMDQRDIPHLIEKLTSNSFHTLLRVAYHAVPVNRNMVGKIYGPEPAVVVVMDFETVMLGEVFRPLMPRVVCERLVEDGYSIVCPEPAEDEEKEG